MKMEQIVVRGIAERLLFEAPDSDYRVFRLHDEADDATYTVTGHGTKPLVGETILIFEPKEHKSIIILVFGTALKEITALPSSILIFWLW